MKNTFHKVLSKARKELTDVTVEKSSSGETWIKGYTNGGVYPSFWPTHYMMVFPRLSHKPTINNGLEVNILV